MNIIVLLCSKHLAEGIQVGLVVGEKVKKAQANKIQTKVILPTNI